MLKSAIALIVLACLSIGAYVFYQQAAARDDQISKRYVVKKDPPVPIVSTRGHFKKGVIQAGRNSFSYDLAGSREPLLSKPAGDELLVVIHGLNNSPERAESRFLLAKGAATKLGFPGLIVGYSWDSDQSDALAGSDGFTEAVATAKANGKKLAQFLIDYTHKFHVKKISLFAYSVGCYVAVETAQQLDKNPALKNEPLFIDAMYLAGAPIPTTSLENAGVYGTALADRVGVIYNYFSAKDPKLDRFTGGPLVAGLGKWPHPDFKPLNWFDEDASEFMDFTDEDDDLHSIYLGSMSESGSVNKTGVWPLIFVDSKKPIAKLGIERNDSSRDMHVK